MEGIIFLLLIYFLAVKYSGGSIKIRESELFDEYLKNSKYV